jgi:16S rRNA (uracil1498-N3)-methyltransferase
MKMRQLIADKKDIDEEIIRIKDRDDIKHVRSVMRLGDGDTVSVTDGESKAYEAVITEISASEILLRISGHKDIPQTDAPRVILFQSLPKGGKMDVIVRGATALGAAEIVPFISERSIPAATKPERWKKIARESVKQCGRLKVPGVAPLTDFAGMADIASHCERVLLLYENEKVVTLKNALSGFGQGVESLAVIVGPEGGFSETEAESLIGGIGAQAVSIGGAILRAEIAGTAALAMILYEYEL